MTQQGVRVDQSRSNFLLFAILSSKDPAWDPVALGDYASRNVLPELQRVPGVGQAQLFGTERAMRVWIDPAKLQGYGLSSADVTNAIVANPAAKGYMTPEQVATQRDIADYGTRVNFWQWSPRREKYTEVWNEVKAGK